MHMCESVCHSRRGTDANPNRWADRLIAKISDDDDEILRLRWGRRIGVHRTLAHRFACSYLAHHECFVFVCVCICVFGFVHMHVGSDVCMCV